MLRNLNQQARALTGIEFELFRIGLTEFSPEWKKFDARTWGSVSSTSSSTVASADLNAPRDARIWRGETARIDLGSRESEALNERLHGRYTE